MTFLKFEMSWSLTEEESKRIFTLLDRKTVISNYAEQGDLEGLKFLEEIGCWISSSALYLAASTGRLEVVKWMIEERDFSLCEYTMECTVKGGHLELAKYLKSKDCDWCAKTIFKAICANQVEMVDWLIRSGCPVGILNPIAEAAQRGNKEMIICLRKLGMRWTEYAYECAEREGYDDLCKWMKENGCPEE